MKTTEPRGLRFAPDGEILLKTFCRIWVKNQAKLILSKELTTQRDTFLKIVAGLPLPNKIGITDEMFSSPTPGGGNV